MNLLTQRQLDPHTIDIRQTGDTLTLVSNGEEAPIAQIVRCFPFSTPEQWISLRADTGDELGLLHSLDGLNAQSRSLIEERLKDRYHIPTITAIKTIEPTTMGGTIWHVDTESDGPSTFTIRGERSFDLSNFPEILFTDAITRTRYKIIDYTALDRPSQKTARAHLRMGSRRDAGSRSRSRGRG